MILVKTKEVKCLESTYSRNVSVLSSAKTIDAQESIPKIKSYRQIGHLSHAKLDYGIAPLNHETNGNILVRLMKEID